MPPHTKIENISFKTAESRYLLRDGYWVECRVNDVAMRIGCRRVEDLIEGLKCYIAKLEASNGH